MDGSLYKGNIRSKEIQGLKKKRKERRKEKALGGTKGGKTRFPREGELPQAGERLTHIVTRNYLECHKN